MFRVIFFYVWVLYLCPQKPEEGMGPVILDLPILVSHFKCEIVACSIGYPHRDSRTPGLLLRENDLLPLYRSYTGNHIFSELVDSCTSCVISRSQHLIAVLYICWVLYSFPILWSCFHSIWIGLLWTCAKILQWVHLILSAGYLGHVLLFLQSHH